MRLCPKCGKKTQEARCPEDGTATLVLAANPDSRLTEGTEVNGRYRIRQMIGQGGFGAVYKATNIATDQDMAIKLLAVTLDGDDSDLIQRFFAEAQVTASLKHPNTIRVFDFGQTEGGALYIAMELLSGQSLNEALRARLHESRALTEEETINIGVQVLRSLAEAHLSNLVHRDLKPHNIFLHEVDGDDPVVKVLDFGIAKRLGSNLTGTGKAFGTPSYMSPEQAQNKNVDRRSDIYSLGCVLYQCVSGKPPFDGDNPLAVLLSHVTDTAADLRQVARTPVSDAFARVIEKALAKNPDDRFATAIEMRQALEAARGSEKTEHLRSPTSMKLPAMASPADDERTAAYGGDDRTAAYAAPGALDTPSAPGATPRPSDAPARVTGSIPGPVLTAGPGDQPTYGFFSQSAEAAVAGTTPPRPVSAPDSDDDDPVPAPRKSGKMLVFAAAGVLVAGAGLAFALMPGGDPTAPAEPPTQVAGLAAQAGQGGQTAQAAPTPPPPAEPPAPAAAADAGETAAADVAPAPPAAVSVQLVSEPPGASVQIGGKVEGTTPLAVQVRAGAEVRAVLTLAGHRDLEVQIGADDAPAKKVSLTAQPAPAARKPPRPGKASSSKGERPPKTKSALEERL